MIWIEIWTRKGVSLPRWAKLAGTTRAQPGMSFARIGSSTRKSAGRIWRSDRYCVDATFLPETSEEKAQKMSLFLALRWAHLAQGYPGFRFL